jgi:large-conductance mechanosensitive channel
MNKMSYKINKNAMAEIYHNIRTNVSGVYTKVFSDFQEFMYSNHVLVAATGWCVGMATKEVIEKVLNHMVLPLVHFMLRFNIWHILYNKLLDHYSKTGVAVVLTTIGNITWDVFVWIVVIFLTFFILEYVLNRRIIGLKSAVVDDNRTDFVKSKAQAGERIIPNEEEIQQVFEKQHIEKVAGAKLARAEEKTMEKVATTPVNDLASANPNLEGYTGNDGFSLFDDAFQ